ncbi:hypothetical protein [Rhizobium terrae]|uniref:hypothetical protein n=1 Tax=Rhizobium terrae TaxID=2171756 RepID=UPI0013C348E9|nr:hypothetical protein [Rhizobium terrae]
MGGRIKPAGARTRKGVMCFPSGRDGRSPIETRQPRDSPEIAAIAAEFGLHFLPPQEVGQAA